MLKSEGECAVAVAGTVSLSFPLLFFFSVFFFLLLWLLSHDSPFYVYSLLCVSLIICTGAWDILKILLSSHS